LLNILGWTSWVIIVLLALAWALGLRTYTRKGVSVPTAMAVQTLFMWVIAIFFFFFHLSKLSTSSGLLPYAFSLRSI
jgi:hypothetical protein